MILHPKSRPESLSSYGTRFSSLSTHHFPGVSTCPRSITRMPISFESGSLDSVLVSIDVDLSFALDDPTVSTENPTFRRVSGSTPAFRRASYRLGYYIVTADAGNLDKW